MANPQNPGDPKSKAERLQLRQSELVDKLAPDPSQPQSLTVLSGILGRSPQSGYWRLYLTAALDEYAEVREEDIIHSHSVEPGQSAFGETMVWVRSDAELQHTRVTSHKMQAEFLNGPIATRFMAGAARFQPSTGSLGVNPAFITYNSINRCPSDRCSTDVPLACRSHYCGPGGGGSVSAANNCVVVTVDIC